MKDGIGDSKGLTRLSGVLPKQKRRIVLMDWNKKEHPVDEEKIKRGFSYLFADGG